MSFNVIMDVIKVKSSQNHQENDFISDECFNMVILIFPSMKLKKKNLINFHAIILHQAAVPKPCWLSC